jgi:hypothetical protein
MDEHQSGGKEGRGRLPNGMPIPSMASIIASLSPGQFPLATRYGKPRCAVSSQVTGDN